MMCLRCGEEVTPGVDRCEHCGHSPYSPAPSTAELNAASPRTPAPDGSPPLAQAREGAGSTSTEGERHLDETGSRPPLSESQRVRVAFLTQKLALDPDRDGLLVQLAEVFEEAGDFPMAASYYKACVDLGEGHAEAARRLDALAKILGMIPPVSVDSGSASASERAKNPTPATPVSRRSAGLGSAPPTTVWWARPRSWRVVALLLVLATGGAASYGILRASRKFAPLGTARPSFGAAFSTRGALLAVLEPASSSGGESLSWGSAGGVDARVRVFDLPTRKALTSFPDANTPSRTLGPSWGADRMLAIRTAGTGWTVQRISVFDMRTKSVLVTLEGANAACSPDGRFVAYEKRVERTERRKGYGSWGSETRRFPEIFVFDLSARSEVQVTDGGGSRPVWSRDSSALLFVRERIAERGERRAYSRYEYDFPNVIRERVGVDVWSVAREGGVATRVTSEGMNTNPKWVSADDLTVSWIQWEAPDAGRSWDDDYRWAESDDAMEALALGGRLMLGSSAGGGESEVLGPESEAIRLDTAAWSPDGSQVVYERVIAGSGMIVANRRQSAKLGDFKDETDLHVYDRVAKRSRRLRGDSADHRSLPVWSPDGKRMAYTVHEWAIPHVEVMTWERLAP